MNAFEKEIERTFQMYRDMKVAHLQFLYPPMRIAGMVGPAPCWVQSGKAPFDLWGYYYDEAGTSLGIELKESSHHENRLPIVGPDKKGTGLQFHQLEGLVKLHQAGGVALLVWSNAGEIGVLAGDALHLAKVQYDASLKAERGRREVASGTRSILWGHFKPVKSGLGGVPLWLPPSPVSTKKKGA